MLRAVFFYICRSADEKLDGTVPDQKRPAVDSVAAISKNVIVVFGVLNLNKPPDVTSRDVVNVVQRLIRPAKVGHAGTLDPLATGVLLVCVGNATRLISLLQEMPKTYLAEFTLGQQSDTDDSTGTIEHLPLAGDPPSEPQIRAALDAFVGYIEQVPPAFSAVKINGQRAYAKARRGEEVALTPKSVHVHRIDVLGYAWPRLTVRIECGSGTYVRSIARDLGKLLQCGGLMSALERSAIGHFDVSQAVSPDGLTLDAIQHSLVNPIQIVGRLLHYHCDDQEIDRLMSGRSLSVNDSQLKNHSAISTNQLPQVAFLSNDGQQLLAIGELDLQQRQLHPRQVLGQRGL